MEIPSNTLDAFLAKVFRRKVGRPPKIHEVLVEPGIYNAVDASGRIRMIYGERARRAMIRLAA